MRCRKGECTARYTRSGGICGIEALRVWRREEGKKVRLSVGTEQCAEYRQARRTAAVRGSCGGALKHLRCWNTGRKCCWCLDTARRVSQRTEGRVLSGTDLHVGSQYGIRGIVAVAVYLWISVINNARRGSELRKETGSVYLRELGDGKVRSFAGCVSYYPPMASDTEMMHFNRGSVGVETLGIWFTSSE